MFPEKSYTKYDGETIPRPFTKTSRLSMDYLWINSLNFFTVCFDVRLVEDYRNTLKLSCRLLTFTVVL